jgi:hypothetical protein
MEKIQMTLASQKTLKAIAEARAKQKEIDLDKARLELEQKKLEVEQMLTKNFKPMVHAVSQPVLVPFEPGSSSNVKRSV